MIGSINAQVTPIESTPVSGVEIRNAVVEPRLAPARRRALAVGNTEHEHRGRGAPISAARRTER